MATNNYLTVVRKTRKDSKTFFFDDTDPRSTRNAYDKAGLYQLGGGRIVAHAPAKYAPTKVGVSLIGHRPRFEILADVEAAIKHAGDGIAEGQLYQDRRAEMDALDARYAA